MGDEVLVRSALLPVYLKGPILEVGADVQIELAIGSSYDVLATARVCAWARIAYALRTMFRTALTVILLVGILGSTTVLAQTASDDTPASTPDASLTSTPDAPLTSEQQATLQSMLNDVGPVATADPSDYQYLTTAN